MKRKAPGGRGRELTLATDLYPPVPLHFHILPFFLRSPNTKSNGEKKKKMKKGPLYHP